MIELLFHDIHDTVNKNEQYMMPYWFSLKIISAAVIAVNP